MQVLFYAFFAGSLYPASTYLHPHGFYERMAPLVPVGLHGLLKVPLSLCRCSYVKGQVCIC